MPSKENTERAVALRSCSVPRHRRLPNGPTKTEPPGWSTKVSAAACAAGISKAPAASRNRPSPYKYSRCTSRYPNETPHKRNTKFNDFVLHARRAADLARYKERVVCVGSVYIFLRTRACACAYA